MSELLETQLFASHFMKEVSTFRYPIRVTATASHPQIAHNRTVDFHCCTEPRPQCMDVHRTQTAMHEASSQMSTWFTCGSGSQIVIHKC